MNDLSPLTRAAWLRAHGYKDPFPSRGYQTETDPFYKDTKAFLEHRSAFVDIGGLETDGIIDQIKNKEIDNGAYFFFGKPGSGKTCLRKFLCSELEIISIQVQSLQVIEYTDHNFEKSHPRISDHLEKIVKKTEGKIKLSLSNVSSFEHFPEVLRDNGIETLCILIDGFKADQYHLIQAISESREVLNTAGLIFFFFFPIEYKHEENLLSNNSNGIYPSIDIRWQENHLKEALVQRLAACCVDDELRDLRSFVFSRFCVSELVNIDDELVNYGKKRQSVREMWRLADRILYEFFHSSKSATNKRAINERINQLVYQTAYKYISPDWQPLSSMDLKRLYEALLKCNSINDSDRLKSFLKAVREDLHIIVKEDPYLDSQVKELLKAIHSKGEFSKFIELIHEFEGGSKPENEFATLLQELDVY